MGRPDDGSLPIGGTTGLSHEHSAVVEEAAARPRHHWPEPIIQELRKLFGVSTEDACAAIRRANEL
jgi:hypothetical protein